MTKMKNPTKRALMLSVMALVLCFTMLVGTTYAWFTDSVTSGKNKIVAGNLDVEVFHTNDKVKDEDLTGAENLFPVDKWEPGVVSYETFTITNKGTLALDYEFNFRAVDFNNVVLADGTATDLNLKDVIKIGIIEGAVDKDTTREELIAKVNAVEEKEGSAAKKLASFNDVKFGSYMEGETNEKTFTVVAYWEPNVKNDDDYNVNNGKSVDKPNGDANELYIDIAVNVYAKQRTYEKDGFGSEYDMNAEFVREISDTASLAAALQNGGTYKLTNDIAVDETINVSAGAAIKLDLNGHNLDASQNTSRPFELADGVSLTINGDDETIVKMGAYGLVNIPTNVTEATITLNGGNYVGKTDNGSMIKPRGYGEITVNLNGVTVKDESDNESWIINTSHYYSNKLTVNVNGGSYTGFNGFDSGGPLSLTDVTMNIKHVAVYNAESGYGTIIVDSCNITVTNEGTAGMNNNYPNACIAASGNAAVTVKNSALTNATGNATSIYTSGGSIALENCQIIGRHTQYHDYDSYHDAAFSTTIDGEKAEIVYPNCPNGCKTYNH